MILWIALGAEQVNLVYGHGAEQLQAAVKHDNLNWCLQAEQLGTVMPQQAQYPISLMMRCAYFSW